MSDTTNTNSVTHDKKTQSYFDANTPVYSTGRYSRILGFIGNDRVAGRSFVDLGCGTGNIIKLFADGTGISDLAGVDVSEAYLKKCRENNPGAKTYLGSILQGDLSTALGRRFGFVLVGAVLHHLVDKTRAQSFAFSKQALANAWSIVEPGGCLVIMEPTFRPKATMSLLFYVKRGVSQLTSKRVSVFGYWNNLGEPVVSYMSHQHVKDDLLELPGGTLEMEAHDTKRLSLLWRLCGITERSDSVFILRKSSEANKNS